MYRIWKEAGNSEKAEISREIMTLGKLMTATEIRSTHWYWQVRKEDQSKEVYPNSYSHNVVGILWSTMAQFGTWFGNSPHFIYGIQLLPLTPIAEYRDDLDWMNEMYYPLSQACYFSIECSTSGWAILQLAVLATVGYPEVAIPRVENLSRDAFLTAGGNGQSKSNTIWYLATRPAVQNPVPLDSTDLPGSGPNRPTPPPAPLTDCLVPESCTSDVLDMMADGYSCRARMLYLINEAGFSERDACYTVAVDEHPDPCGPCNPDGAIEENPVDEELLDCLPCSQQQCSSDVGSCFLDEPFVCLSGDQAGECSSFSLWKVSDSSCSECCEITEACFSPTTEAPIEMTLPPTDARTSIPTSTQGSSPTDAPAVSEATEPPTLQPAATEEGCPPCDDTVCSSNLSLCPDLSPFVCISGAATGGCSSSPWIDSSGPSPDCAQCCELNSCDTFGEGNGGGSPMNEPNEEPTEAPVEPVADKCPVCDSSICSGSLGQCPQSARYVCTQGNAIGGCSTEPWQIPSPDCYSCCELECSGDGISNNGGGDSPVSQPVDQPAAVPVDQPVSQPTAGGCPVCDSSVCDGSLGQCPESAPFVCTEGSAIGGCSPGPWQTPSADCTSCCELNCSSNSSSGGGQSPVNQPAAQPVAQPVQPIEEGCPACDVNVCNSYLASCPSLAPFVCMEGRSSGGCSSLPWQTSPDVNADCSSCCELSCSNDDSGGSSNPPPVDAPVATPTTINENADCPPCSTSICESLNQCPTGAPYLCSEGPATGGCSLNPWDVVVAVDCTTCCSAESC